MPAGAGALIEVVERKSWVDDLARDLKNDHEEIRRQEWVLKMLVYRAEYAFALQRAAELQVFLGQHFLKEESGLHYVLVHKNWAEFSATDPVERKKLATEKLMRRHKEMANSLQDIVKLSSLSTEQEKLQAFDNFELRFLNLLKEEEDDASVRPFFEGSVQLK